MKNVTIHFSKAGIHQYQELTTDEEGNLINPRIFVQYTPVSELPAQDNLKTLNDALEYLKNISYNKKAVIWAVNGKPVFWGDKQNKILENLREDLVNIYTNFFVDAIIPLLNDRKYYFDVSYVYPRLIIDNKEIYKFPELYRNLNYLCYQFLYILGKTKYDNFTPESYHTWEYLSKFLSNVREDVLITKNSSRNSK